MKIIPAIDLLSGQAVRLFQGSYDQVTSYSQDPVQQAKLFERSGAKLIHLVDLDAARSGAENQVTNREHISRICKACTCEIEVGGGIRSERDVKALLDLGVKRLIIGTLLAKQPDEVARWMQGYDASFIAGIDARDGEVKISGWEEGSSIRDEELAARVGQMGMAGIVYTNISKDGTLQGPDIEGTLRIAEAAGIPVIVSGGMGTMDDCAAVHRACHAYADGARPPIEGVIIGKALYEGSIDLAAAVSLYQGALN